jgi:hypothetical protein
VWHASACIWDEAMTGPIPIAVLGADDLSHVRFAARQLVRGVGDGEDIWETGRIAVHLRRRVHPREMDWQASDVRRPGGLR